MQLSKQEVTKVISLAGNGKQSAKCIQAPANRGAGVCGRGGGGEGQAN